MLITILLILQNVICLTVLVLENLAFGKLGGVEFYYNEIKSETFLFIILIPNLLVACETKIWR